MLRWVVGTEPEVSDSALHIPNVWRLSLSRDASFFPHFDGSLRYGLKEFFDSSIGLKVMEFCQFDTLLDSRKDRGNVVFDDCNR